MVSIRLNGKSKKIPVSLDFSANLSKTLKSNPAFSLFVIFLLPLAATETGETRRTKSGRLTRKSNEGIDQGNDINGDRKQPLTLTLKTDTYLLRAAFLAVAMFSFGSKS